jgi:hypothetical protein
VRYSQVERYLRDDALVSAECNTDLRASMAATAIRPCCAAADTADNPVPLPDLDAGVPLQPSFGRGHRLDIALALNVCCSDDLTGVVQEEHTIVGHVDLLAR